ncbi:hypothetical protein [Sediminicoccus sp. KRV36]|uniref:phage head spike fiber domain-containing protein n=1 Tax=Sediminicoccus sp. KRV36 TaxID=3133721 RepID=UPI00200DCDF9|nr:hypothetical protein [Sediminicoccus rosea]UPY35503.1 hypothetical protein LHU95_14890 [Sediminicoccus rosea]
MIGTGISFWRGNAGPISLMDVRGLHSAANFTRGSAAWQVVGGSLLAYGSNVPRFDPTLGLMLEGQRTNRVLDSAAGIANPGPAPNANVASTDIPSFGAGTLIRKHTRDTAAASNNVGALAGFSVVAGQKCAMHCWIYLPSSQNYGGAPALTLSQDLPTSSATLVDANLSIRDQWQRISRVYVPSTTADYPMVLRADIASGSFFYSCQPQFEDAAFCSSPIVTTGMAGTRLTDNLTFSLAALGIPASGACTIWGEFMLPQPAPAGLGQWLLQTDDASDTFRWSMRNSAGSSLVVANANGVDAATFSMTPGASFYAAIASDGAGRIANTVSGGAVVSVSGAPTSGMTTLRIANTAAGGNSPYGYCRALRYLPYALPDAALPGLRA